MGKWSFHSVLAHMGQEEDKEEHRKNVMIKTTWGIHLVISD